MEPASFAIGLAGAFTSCVDILIRVKKFRNFKDDSRILSVRFNRARHQFERWGEQVGILQQDGNSTPGERSLDDSKRDASQSEKLVSEHLAIIEELFPSEDKARDSSGPSGSQHPAQSKRKRFSWALGGKEVRNEHVTAFEQLVQNLYELMPPEDPRKDNAVDSLTLSSVEVLHDMLREMGEKAALSRRKEVFRWLDKSPLDEEQLDKSLKAQVEGTCQWIHDRQAFQEWKSGSGSSNILWINGPGGFGKTVLCASLVQKLSMDNHSLVASHFFSSDLRSRDDPTLALRSWIAQIVKINQSAFDMVSNYSEEDVNPTASRKSIRSIFASLCGIANRWIFVLDGIDECSLSQESERYSTTDLLQFVVDNLQESGSQLLIVSRNLMDIRQVLESAQSGFIEHSISREDVEDDTAALSESIVQKKLGKKSLQERSIISATLRDKSEGQFLWIYLQEGKLRPTRPITALRESLEHTPAKLSDIYQRDWNRILASDSKQWAISLLRWTVCAMRPLTVAETVAAIMVNKPVAELNEYKNLLDEEFVNEEIKATCGSLLDVHQDNTDQSVENMRLRIPHFTVHEFLFHHLPCPSEVLEHGHTPLNIEEWQHALLTRSCLEYLNNSLVWKGQNFAEPLLWLRCYASDYWSNHAAKGWRPIFSGLAVDLITRDTTLGWRRRIERISANDAGDAPSWTPLAHAVRLNLEDIMLALIEQTNCDLNEQIPGLNASPPLILACRDGTYEMARILLENGASVSARSPLRDLRAIHIASYYGREPMVQLLISYGACVNAKSSDLQTPLIYASASGDLPTVKLLVSKGADISAKGELGRTALAAAASAGHNDIVKFLLSFGAKVNEVAHEEATALYHACAENRLDVILTLLKHGADVNIVRQKSIVFSPLLGVSQAGYTRIVRELLRHGADIEYQSNIGTTPLICAARYGHYDTVVLLLAQHAQVDAPSHSGTTALSEAARTGHENIVVLLLEHKAQVDTFAFGGITPLHRASMNGHVTIASILIRAGANVNNRTTRDYKDRTPLMSAAHKGCDEAVALLCREGANIEEINGRGNTSLCIAAREGHVSVVHVLLDEGAYVDSTNFIGCTPLFSAIESCNMDVIIALVNAGADVCHLDRRGASPLYHACWVGNVNVVDFLMNRGAAHQFDLKRRDGYRPLAAASQGGHLGVVIRLLDLGANPNHVDNVDCKTALDFASELGHIQVVEALLRNGAIAAMSSGLLWQPLHWAAKSGHLSVVQTLLEQDNVDPTIRTADGRTPLHLAAMHGHLSVVESLLKCEGVEAETEDALLLTPLSGACFQGHVEVIKLLLADPKVRLNHQDHHCLTPLYYATASGQVSAVKALLADERTDLDLRSHCNEKLLPLVRAVQNGHSGVVRSLISSSKGDKNLQSNLIRAALCLAPEGADDELLSTILEDGVRDPNCLLGSGLPLSAHVAAYGNAADLTRIIDNPLTNIGENISCRISLLSIVAANGNDDGVGLLLEHPRVDPQETDVLRRAPLYYASRYGHESVVRLLLADGRSSVRAQDWQQLSPLFTAVANGHGAVVKALLPHFDKLDDEGGLGHGLLWWGERSGDAETQEALASFAGAEYTSCANERIPPSVRFEEEENFCDSCTLTIPQRVQHYMSYVALGIREMALCSYCYSRCPVWPGFDLRDFHKVIL